MNDFPAVGFLVLSGPVFLSEGWKGPLLSLLCVVVAYLLGNISPAILIGRLHGIDIKKEGSGNAGTTNVLRVLGKRAAAETLFVDIGKGGVAVWIGWAAGFALMEEPKLLAVWCCVAVFCGHIWPAAFGFRGGKGIATGFGAITAASLYIGVFIMMIAVAGIALSRRVSVGSICGALALIAVAFYLEPAYAPYFTVMALIAVWKHRSNIKRLLCGEEPKLSFKK